MIELVETTVIVDILRGHPPALVWLGQRKNVATTPLTWMEIIFGAQNKIAQQQSMKVLRLFDVVYLTADDQEWAMQQLFTYRLSHGIGVTDCLIASVCHRLNVPLYTHNLKHFAPLLGALAQQPY